VLRAYSDYHHDHHLVPHLDQDRTVSAPTKQNILNSAKVAEESRPGDPFFHAMDSGNKNKICFTQFIFFFPQCNQLNLFILESVVSSQWKPERSVFEWLAIVMSTFRFFVIESNSFFDFDDEKTNVSLFFSPI
jgi:hypothetical protein